MFCITTQRAVNGGATMAASRCYILGIIIPVELPVIWRYFLVVLYYPDAACNYVELLLCDNCCFLYTANYCRIYDF